MKTTLDCYPCFLKMGMQAARLAGANDDQLQRVMDQILGLLKDSPPSGSPLDIAEQVQAIVQAETGNADPYLQVKHDCNAEAARWVPALQHDLDHSDSPLRTALKIAAIGNIMDSGTFASFNVGALIHQLHHREFAVDAVESFALQLEQARSITYFADNTGEIHFDSLLIQMLCDSPNVSELKLVIRSHPFLNDVCSESFVPVTLRQLEKVSLCSLPIAKGTHDPDQWAALSTSDLVLSKGMANFENYSDAPGFFFLLISKCDLVSRLISEKSGKSVTTGDWVFMKNP